MVGSSNDAAIVLAEHVAGGQLPVDHVQHRLRSQVVGDDNVDGLPYEEIVAEAAQFIAAIGGFEKFAEWGLF